jgi:Effector protein
MIQWDAARFPGIYIGTLNDRDPGLTFVQKTKAALEQISRWQLGYDLLDIISKRSLGIGSGKGTKDYKRIMCLIEKGEGTCRAKGGAMATAGLDGKMDDIYATSRVALDGANYTAHGKFASGVVSWNPDFVTRSRTVDGGTIKFPDCILVAHELIHVMHFMSGDTGIKAESPEIFIDLKGGKSGERLRSIMNEEARTVGVGKYAQGRITENAFRRLYDRSGLPGTPIGIRTFYSRPGDCDDL